MSAVLNHSGLDSPRHRSATPPGSWLLENVDGRSSRGRRFSDLCRGFADQLGGEGKLTVTQHGLIRHAAAVTLQAEDIQTAIVRGESVNHMGLARVTFSLVRTLRSLGIAASTHLPSATGSHQ